MLPSSLLAALVIMGKVKARQMFRVKMLSLPEVKAHRLQNVCWGDKGREKRAQWEWIKANFHFHLLSYFKCNSSLNRHLYCGVQQPNSAVGNRSIRRAGHSPTWQEINTWPGNRSRQTGRGEGAAGWLTPQVVMTGSLNTLQHSWQHSFTEGCSANTCGSWEVKERKGERERKSISCWTHV